MDVSNFSAPLLTGATGFAGGHMLAKLLHEERRPVFCLVRRRAAGLLPRIEANLKSYGIWEDQFRRWIRPIEGDLGHPTLGLSETALSALAERVDAIYHFGGDTHWLRSYDELFDVNVGSTFALARIASMRAGTPLVFLSSLGVYPNLSAANEEQAALGSAPLLNGYAESKRAAERTLQVLDPSRNPCLVVRTASLSASTVTGVGNRNRTIEMFIASCLALGKAPDADLFFWDLLPVDFLIDFVRSANQSGAAESSKLNVVLPDRRERQRLVRDHLHARGVDIVDYDSWRRDMLARPDLPIYPLRGFFPAGNPIANGCRNDAFLDRLDALEMTACRVDHDVLGRCVDSIDALYPRHTTHRRSA